MWLPRVGRASVRRLPRAQTDPREILPMGLTCDTRDSSRVPKGRVRHEVAYQARRRVRALPKLAVSWLRLTVSWVQHCEL